MDFIWPILKVIKKTLDMPPTSPVARRARTPALRVHQGPHAGHAHLTSRDHVGAAQGLTRPESAEENERDGQRKGIHL